jgi:hypothetical protein
MTSFLRQGHAFHLFAYQRPEGVPDGVELFDATEILPSSSIFLYREEKSLAGFANYFRYKLLLDRGGWWVDADTVCLKPFDFPQAHVFSSESDKGAAVPNAGMIKAPAGSALMQYAWDFCRSRNGSELKWGETGSVLIREILAKFSAWDSLQSPDVFCPIPYKEWRGLLAPDFGWSPHESTRSVHLWNEFWRRNGVGKDQRFHPDCLYERLRRDNEV